MSILTEVKQWANNGIVTRWADGKHCQRKCDQLSESERSNISCGDECSLLSWEPSYRYRVADEQRFRDLQPHLTMTDIQQIAQLYGDGEDEDHLVAHFLLNEMFEYKGKMWRSMCYKWVHPVRSWWVYEFLQNRSNGEPIWERPREHIAMRIYNWAGRHDNCDTHWFWRRILHLGQTLEPRHLFGNDRVRQWWSKRFQSAYDRLNTDANRMIMKKGWADNWRWVQPSVQKFFFQKGERITHAIESDPYDGHDYTLICQTSRQQIYLVKISWSFEKIRVFQVKPEYIPN